MPPNCDDSLASEENLEWITPKISLMQAKISQAKAYNYGAETSKGEGMGVSWCGAFGVCGPS